MDNLEVNVIKKSKAGTVQGHGASQMHNMHFNQQHALGPTAVRSQHSSMHAGGRLAQPSSFPEKNTIIVF